MARSTPSSDAYCCRRKASIAATRSRAQGRQGADPRRLVADVGLLEAGGPRRVEVVERVRVAGRRDRRRVGRRRRERQEQRALGLLDERHRERREHLGRVVRRVRLPYRRT